jgi:hypothetical protein
MKTNRAKNHISPLAIKAFITNNFEVSFFTIIARCTLIILSANYLSAFIMVLRQVSVRKVLQPPVKISSCSVDKRTASHQRDWVNASWDNRRLKNSSGSQSPDADSLKRHSRSHSGQKPYASQHCNRWLNTRKFLLQCWQAYCFSPV